MSVNKDNQTYKKTSFLSGVNSDFIQEYYALYLENPKLLTKDWIEFFSGLNENDKNILQNIQGPSWNPKKVRQIKINQHSTVEKEEEEDLEIGPVKQASTDSVRAIMLIRAYRIRGHLIANLDPLNLQEKEEHLELKPETYGFKKKDYDRKIFLDGVLGLQYGSLNEILKILKKTYCSNIGYEFMHMSDPEEKAWVRNRIEGPEKDIFTDNGKKQF